MTPAPWVFVLLALAGWRSWRLLAQDDLPPVAAARNRLVGAVWSETAGAWLFDRPLLAHFLQCAYCSGWWVALCWWGGWLVWPRGAVVLAVPFALSAAVGLVAQRLGSGGG